MLLVARVLSEPKMPTFISLEPHGLDDISHLAHFMRLSQDLLVVHQDPPFRYNSQVRAISGVVDFLKK